MKKLFALFFVMAVCTNLFAQSSCTVNIVKTAVGTNPVGYIFKTDPVTDGSTYLWTFGDNTKSDSPTPTHTFATGGKYLVTVKVTDKTGKVCTGELTAEFSGGTATTPPTTTVTCAAATELAVTEITSSAARIKFVLPREIQGASLEIRENSATSWTSIALANTSLTYYDLKELKATTKYYYRIKTTCSANNVTATPETANFTTSAAPVTCTAATAVSVGEITASSVRVKFTLPANITGATLEIREATATTWTPIELAGTTLTYYDKKELKASTTYVVRVKTVCVGGTVLYSSLSDFTTVALPTTEQTCNGATGLTVSSIGVNAVKISYVLPSGITSATLQIVTASTPINDATVWMQKTLVIPSTYTERGELLAATKYIYRIKTICTNGTIKYSSNGDFITGTAQTTPPVLVCAAATELSATNITGTSARLNFKLPQEIKEASIEIIAANSTVWLSRSITLGSTFYDRNELRPATKYYYRVKTVCANGSSSYTPQSSFETAGNKSGELSTAVPATGTNAELTVTCFPNPASSNITVNILGGSGQLADLQLSNIYGKVVFRSQFPENEIQNISVQSYPRGIYVLKVSESNKTSSIKIVLN